jgi:hypothetical protein
MSFSGAAPEGVMAAACHQRAGARLPRLRPAVFSLLNVIIYSPNKKPPAEAFYWESV